MVGADAERPADVPMTDRGYRLLILAFLGLALLAIYQAGPGGVIVVPSGQAEGGGSAGPSTPAAWPERMVIEAREPLVVEFAPTVAPTPRPRPTPRPTETPVALCPPTAPGYCVWPTPLPAPIYPTPIPTCSATPEPGMGCIWTGE